MQISIPRDANDVQIHVTGADLKAQPATTILDVRELKGAPSALRLSSAVFAIQTGVVLYLWWDDDHGDTLILPLEGRGSLNFDPIGGIVNPRKEGWTGCVQLSTQHEGLKSFFLGLEFAKLRE